MLPPARGVTIRLNPRIAVKSQARVCRLATEQRVPGVYHITFLPLRNVAALQWGIAMSNAESLVAPIAERTPPRTVLQWISTSNPFYVLSAFLFLAGLKMSFGAHSREVDSWALMVGLAGYTLLLAAAALILVRFARVWNDVRTVLLLVVLMFIATSVTFDELLVLNPERGRWFFVGGLCFAIVLSEFLLRSIRLRLPLRYRVPYHCTLALFFLYPLVLVTNVQEPLSAVLMWKLWAFAPTAGVVFLLLIPAIRAGQEYTRDNGSPWPWPLYPWSLFAFLAFAVCARAVLLCWSFHFLPSKSELIFGPYFLVPFGFAITILLLEFAVKTRNAWVHGCALVLPIALVTIAGIGHSTDAIYRMFLAQFSAQFGCTPLFAALVCAAAYYGFACARRLRFAPEAAMLCIAGFAWVSPQSLTLDSLAYTRPLWVVLATGLFLSVALVRWERMRLVIASIAGIVWLGELAWRGYRELRELVAGLDFIVLSLVLLPIAVLVSLTRAGVLSRWFDREPEPR